MKTAKQLGITREERNALIAVRLFFLQSAPSLPKRLGSAYGSGGRNPVDAKFYMGEPVRNYDCGTAMCIGGYVKAHLMGVQLTRVIVITPAMAKKISAYVWSQEERDQVLHSLFFPDDLAGGWEKITARQAATAITNFLETGDPKWTEMLPV